MSERMPMLLLPDSRGIHPCSGFHSYLTKQEATIVKFERSCQDLPLGVNIGHSYGESPNMTVIIL